MLSLLGVFLEGALAVGTLVSLSDLVTFLIRFSTSFNFSKKLDDLRPGTYLSTLAISLIFVTFLFLELTYHVSHSLMTQSENTS